ncbi:MAG: DUF1361 domain-containing protein [Flavisolibacter sp.]
MFKTADNIFLKKSSPDKETALENMLMLSCLFSVGLTVLRVLYTGEILFAWLNWNLFLAVIPYAISRFLAARPQWMRQPAKALPVLLCWLLFLPNAFYLLTDLYHLNTRPPVPLWFDLALILSFAWNGLFLGVLSMRQMEKILEAAGLMPWEALFVYPVMLLNALGIFMGRYLRYNSWDILAHPSRLFHDSCYLLIHPLRNRLDWSMILCYSVFMTLVYLTLKKFSRA